MNTNDDLSPAVFVIFFTFLVFFASFLGNMMFGDYSLPLYDEGVCTKKYISNDTHYIILGKQTYTIDPILYDGMIVGEGYTVEGTDNNIDEIQKYTEDAFL